MQRFAFSTTKQRVEASLALHHVDYLCPECDGVVRLRRGQQRAPHFFHKNDGSSCHLRQKEGVHQAVQLYLIEALGKNACTCECFFPEISRVADVVFHPQKIVFEVQVSPIKPEEALKRTLDYWKIGFHVIWLLHASTFGRSDASLFEDILRGIPHYFTDIGYRNGTIWDELSCVRGRSRFWYYLPPRRKKIESLSIDELHKPLSEETPHSFPETEEKYLHMRRSTWSCHFHEDLLCDQSLSSIEKPSSKISNWKRYKVLFQLFWLKLLASK